VHAEINDGMVVIADGEHPVYFPILVGGVPLRRQQQHVEVERHGGVLRCAVAMDGWEQRT